MGVIPANIRTSFPRRVFGNLRPEEAYSVTDRNAVLNEDFFQQMLALERKRSDRSGKPFMLMLLDASSLLDGTELPNATSVQIALISALDSSTRETDVIGWYEQGSVLGILFTELGTSETISLEKTVNEKIYGALYTTLGIRGAERVRITTHFYPETSKGGRTLTDVNIKLYPDLVVHPAERRIALLAKRLLDLVGSLVLLALLSPLMLIIGLLVKVTSEGPIFFRQERVGQFGRSFTFLKFRSMRTNVDSKLHEEYIERFIGQSKNCQDTPENVTNDGIFKLTDDPRITPLGGLLRKTSLDELPQFFNVFKGEMSLVGPRPPIPYELKKYDVWHRRRVLEVKPGITGLWQVKGRSRTTFDDMVRLDMRYIREWSIWLDLRILLATPWAVFCGKGAC